jgi:hypothetical protein
VYGVGRVCLPTLSVFGVIQFSINEELSLI